MVIETVSNRKNIYIRDEDQQVLEEFEAAKGNASELFSEAIRRWKQRRTIETERIVLDVVDEQGTLLRKAFRGKCLASRHFGVDGTDDIYQTERDNFVYYRDDPGITPSTFQVVSSLDELEDVAPADLLAKAMSEIDEDYIQELDI